MTVLTAGRPDGPTSCNNSSMNPSPDFGGVSRPSSHACIATCTPALRPNSTAASRCLSSACTPPVPIRPITCNVPSCRRVCSHSSTSAGILKNSPRSIDCEMRTMSCGTTRPAPRFRCPTSLLPICPSGRPTARPDASSNVRDARSPSVCQPGVFPSSMALPSRPGRKPQPSSTTRITGVRVLRLIGILKGMQVSQIIPALLAVLSLANPQAAASQGGNRYRVSVDNAWFYQDVAGRRIARLARGALLTGGGGATRNDWIQVTLDGWIFATSVGRSDRPDFDLLVTRAPNENLRAAPAGPLVAELSQGFGLKRAPPDSAGRWVHVTRQGWVQRSALAPIADVVATRTADTTRDSTADQGGLTPGPRPGKDTTRVDSTRAQPVRVTTLYRAPDGPEAGTVATDTPLRVLSRNGEWTRVQFEGWGKGGDLQAAPAGVLVGITAAELRAEPQRYAGQVLRWNLEFIAIQKADDLRPDIPSGTSYVLGRGPLPERGFVYVVVPDNKLPAFRALTPLVTMTITARVRNGRSRYLGNPVVDLISLEGGVTP